MDKKKYLAIAVDVDGEVNLVKKSGEIETLFPKGTVMGMSTIAETSYDQVISWLFYFNLDSDDEVDKTRKFHLEYLERAE